MNKTFTKFLLVLFSILFTSQIDLAQTKIMVLGDRIADGTAAVPGEGLITFRRPLHVLLSTNGYYVDFVGGRTNQLQDFDANHQSDSYLLDDHTGNSSLVQLADTAYDFLNLRKPNVVLFYAGYHDFRAGDNAAQMLMDIDSVFAEFEDYATKDPNVHYFISGLVGTQEYLDSVFTAYNTGLKEKIENYTGTAKLHFIDVLTESNFDPAVDVYQDPGKEFGTQAGYNKMAKVFYNHIKTVLTPGGTRPSLVSPSNGTVVENENVELNWSRITGTNVTYRLQIAIDSLFTNKVLDSTNITDTTFTFNGADSNTVYLWRVIPTGTGTNYSAAYSFSFKSTPVIITVNAPTELTFAVNDSLEGSVVLNWTDNSDNEQGFVIERREGVGEYSVLETLDANVTSFEDVVNVGPSYSYRVRAFVDTVFSDYSNVVTIMLTDVEELAAMPTEFALKQNYPNPFNPSTTINYQLPFAGQVSLKIYDVLGNEVANLVEAYMPAGYHNVNFNAGNLASGVYLYQIRIHNSQNNSNFIDTKKLLLVK